MARIYNSFNNPQSPAGLLARNLYTSEQIEYKLRQKIDKISVYTKQEIDNRLSTLSGQITTSSNNFISFSSYLSLSDTINFPIKWNGTRLISCLNSATQYDGINPIPLGWNDSSKTLSAVLPILNSGSERNSNNPGLYLGRQSIISGGSFNSESIENQENPSLSQYATEVYSGSTLLWKQFEQNNRILIKNTVAVNNNSLGANSLYTGELGININTGEIFIGWQGKSADPANDIPLSGIKRLFSPQSYIKRNPLTGQTIQAASSVNIPSLIIKGSQISLGSEVSRADILQILTRDGDKKVYIESDGTLNTNSINLNTTISSSTDSVTHKIPIKVSGQTYYILLSNV